MPPETTSDDALKLAKSHAYFHGLPDDVLVEVAAFLRVQRFVAGDVVYHANERVKEIGFIVAGRLKGVIIDADGIERLFRFAERGEAIGLIWAAMTEPLGMEAIAVEPSTVLMLDYQKALELTANSPALRMHWNQKLAGSIRAHLVGDTKKLETSLVAVFHQAEDTRPLTRRLAQRLAGSGETVGVFTDAQQPVFDSGIHVRKLRDGDQYITEGEVHEQIGAWGKPRRIIVDVRGDVDDPIASRLIGISHNVLWISDDNSWQPSVRRLRELEAESPAVRDKVAFVWGLQNGKNAPLAPEVTQVASRDFKLLAEDCIDSSVTVESPGFSRLAHHLQGIRIGLALGGGAARGMAHLGVLRRLEQAGIYVDHIAGTSAGAMVGVLYAAGHRADYIIERFVEDLKPSWLFRNLPRGGYWYLTYKYRRGQFDPMLRNYLEDLRIEQLSIPVSAVTVDLVSGNVIVRNTGDAVHAVLDSINLPLLSQPILRDGQALIDGGFVNNVPADVLVSQGCNLVIAVDVLAKIEQQFAGLGPDSPADEGKMPSAMQTVLRTYAVQSFNMNSIGAQPADVRIEPDTTAFSMSAFTSAPQLAEIGERAAEEKLDTIQVLLNRLSGSAKAST